MRPQAVHEIGELRRVERPLRAGGTDGNVIGSNDDLFRVPTSGPERGTVQQFLTVPFGAEACGPFITADQRSVFIAPQHPGETAGATFENQSSDWPHREGFPRPSVVVVHQR